MPRLSSMVLLLALLLVRPVVAADLSAPEQPMPGYGEWTGSYIGIDIQEVTHERMVALKLREERGAEITMVDHDAPAGQAGLKEHDVILEFNRSEDPGNRGTAPADPRNSSWTQHTVADQP